MRNLSNVMTAEKARSVAIRTLQSQFDKDDLRHLFEKIEESAEQGRFFLKVSMVDEMPETSSAKMRRLLMEYMRLIGYTIFYFGDDMEVRWQI